MVFFWRDETPPKKNIWSVDSSEGAGFDSDSTSRAPENQLINGAIKPPINHLKKLQVELYFTHIYSRFIAGFPGPAL